VVEQTDLQQCARAYLVSLVRRVGTDQREVGPKDQVAALGKPHVIVFDFGLIRVIWPLTPVFSHVSRSVGY
jgi:hypothetical protein